jgi:subtilase family serine protease
MLSSVAALLLFMVGSAQAQSVMTRHTRREVTSGQAKFVSRLPGTQILHLDIVLPLRDQAGLDSFLKEVHDPTSPIYRQFLTVPEFTERFGPTPEDYDAVVAFAKGRGFNVVGGSRDGMEVQVEGSVTVIEAAFNIAMGVYQHPTENRTFYAPDREPSVPLGFPLWHISGLDNFSIPHPALAHRPAGSTPAATTGSGPEASFLGSDMRDAYYGGTLTGTGQSIGLFEFNGTDLADVNTYFKNVGQTNKVPITLISADGSSTSCVYSGVLPCDDTEPTIDITQAVSMAPGMSGLYVFVGRSSTAILSAMSTHSPLSAQLSCSWGWTPPDPTIDDPYFTKMAAQGQNIFVAAGDTAEWTSSNFAYPAQDAYVVSVGGTSLTTESAGGPWASETGWAESGGGVSPLQIPIPSWQTAAAVINDSYDGGASTSYRNGPDVSANADYSYYVCADQSGCTANLIGGTSFAAPLWAGYMALVNQQSKTNGHALLGFLNPLIYPLGLGENYNTYFHDITIGNNGNPAVVGYDLVTGWGSPNGVGLLNILSKTSGPAANFSISITPGSVTVQQGSSGNTTVAAVLTGGWDAAITWSAPDLPTGVTASFDPVTSPAPGSGDSTLTLDVASTVTPGTYTMTVSGSGNGITHTATFSLIVAPPGSFTLSASPTSVSVAQGSSGTSTITSAVSETFDSAVTLTATGAPTGVTVSFSENPIPMPGSGPVTMTMAVGTSTATGKYTITVTGTGGGTSATTTVTLTVLVAANFTISASPTSLSVAPGYSGKSTITTAITGSFSSAILLSASGQPSGVTVSFNPATILAPGSGTSTMSAAVATTTTPGTYPITVTGTGGGITQTATVKLTVTTGFSINASPDSLSVALGSSGTSTITTAVSGGFNSSIALSSTITPPSGGSTTGLTVGFNPATISAPGSGTSTMSVTVATTTATGVYTITVSGTGGGITNQTTVTLTVTSASTFSISASPASVSVAPGSNGTSTITTAVSGGFDSAIALSASGQPSGVTVSFSPTSIAAPGSGTSTMTMAVAASTATGPYTITVTGTGGGVTQTTTVTLTVTTTGGSGGDFNIAASPNSLSLSWGGSGTSTITTTAGSGFDSAISLSASELPSQVIVTFTPASIAAPGSGTSTMGITVREGAPSGTSTFTVTGTGGGKTHTVTITLNISI